MTFARIPVRCRCEWRRISRRSLICRCAKSTRSRRCSADGHRWLFTTTRFILRRNRCLAQRRVLSRAVPCMVGDRVSRGSCDSLTGCRRVSREQRRVVACRCQVRRQTWNCRCRCPAGRRVRLCNRARGVERTVSVHFRLVGCRCESRRAERRRTVRCRRTRVTRGRCRRSGRTGDQRAMVVRTEWRRDGCRCIRKVARRSVLCGCRRQRRQIRRCTGNATWSVYESMRVLRNGKCVRMTRLLGRYAFRCAPRSTTVRCNKKTYVETVTVWRVRPKKCRCIRRKRVIRRKCKCDSTRRFLRRTTCSRRCLRKYVYRFKVLRNHRCVTKYATRTRRCCCPRTRRVRTRCVRILGVLERVEYRLVLRGNKCVTRQRVSTRNIRCSRSVRRRQRRLRSGILIVRTYRYVRMNCKCRVIRRTIVKRWKCWKPKTTRRCSDGGIERRTVSYRLTRAGTCVRRVRTRWAEVRCRPSSRVDSRCKRTTAGSFRERTMVWFVKRGCRCLRRQHRARRVCSCPQPRRVRRCRKSVIEVTSTRYEVSVDGAACVRIVRRNRRPTQCDPRWLYVGRTRCRARSGLRFRVFRRQRRSGCTCRRVVRRRPCVCRCRRPSRRSRCRHGDVREIIRTVYRLSGCKCHRKTYSSFRSIRCGRMRRVRRSLSRCRVEIRTIFFITRNCRCVRRTRRRREKRCCPKSRVIRFCKYNSGHRVTERMSWKLVEGACVRRISRNVRIINCSRKVSRRASRSCVRGRRNVVVTRTVRRGCRCFRQRRVRNRRCPCRRRRTRRSGCRRNAGCTETVRTVTYRYDRAVRKCVRHLRTKTRLCCCPHKRYTRVRCRNNRLIRTTVSWFFSRSRGVCLRRISRADVTKLDKCLPRFQRRRSQCYPNGVMKVVTIHRRLTRCRCHTARTVRVVTCRCPPKTGPYVRCVGNRMKELTMMHSVLKSGRCLLMMSRMVHSVVCPSSKRRLCACNRITCQQKIVYTTYFVHRCRCHVRIHHRMRPCCCRGKRLRRSVKCIGDRIKEVSKTWVVFDSYRRVCVNKVCHRRVTVYCGHKSVSHVGPCNIRIGYSVYRQVTYKIPKPHTCKCRYVLVQRRKLCNCAPSKHFRRCENGLLVSYIIRFVPHGHLGCRKIVVPHGRRRIECKAVSRRMNVGQCIEMYHSGHSRRRVQLAVLKRCNCHCCWKPVIVTEVCYPPHTWRRESGYQPYGGHISEISHTNQKQHLGTHINVNVVYHGPTHSHSHHYQHYRHRYHPTRYAYPYHYSTRVFGYKHYRRQYFNRRLYAKHNMNRREYPSHFAAYRRNPITGRQMFKHTQLPVPYNIIQGYFRDLHHP